MPPRRRLNQNQEGGIPNVAAGGQNPPQAENPTLATLAALAQALNTQNAPQNPQQNQFQVVDRFNKLKPPTFNGRDGPAALEEWMESIEKILELIMCTDAQRVSCASFQFKEDARIWWNAYWGMRPATERAALTWVEFKRIVMEKHYPTSYRIRMESEFFNLKQGNMTVELYERKFSDMCRFASHLVDTETKKAQRFRYDLRSDIRNIISGSGITTLMGMFELAEEVAASIAMDAPKLRYGDNFGKRKLEESRQGEQDNNLKYRRYEGNANENMQQEKPVCNN